MFTNILLAGNNDNILQLSGLKNATDGLFINDATVTATVSDLQGNPLPGMSWPATLNYVTDSQGIYRLLLSSDLNLQNKTFYQVNVNAQAGGLTADWQQTIQSTNRS